jgi:hypothetical protein
LGELRWLLFPSVVFARRSMGIAWRFSAIRYNRRLYDKLGSSGSGMTLDFFF